MCGGCISTTNFGGILEGVQGVNVVCVSRADRFVADCGGSWRTAFGTEMRYAEVTLSVGVIFFSSAAAAGRRIFAADPKATEPLWQSEGSG